MGMWLLFAILAAVFWGLDYAFAEKVFREVSVIGALALTTMAAGVVLTTVALAIGRLQEDVHTLLGDPKTLLYLIISALAFVLADLLIGTSITARNATLASLVEISYPLFVATFGYFVFGERSLNAGVSIGGLLIMAGVATIYVSSRGIR